MIYSIRKEKSSIMEKKTKSLMDAGDIEKKADYQKPGFFERRFNRIFIKIIIIAIIAAAAVAGGTYGFKKLTAASVEKKHALVASELEQCQELVILKNRYSDIITIKKTRIAGLARSFSIVRYTGIVRAGIPDLTKSKVTVSHDGKSVHVVLPQTELLGNDISTLEVFDEYKNIFVPISTQEIFDQVNKSREDTVQDLVSGGLLDDAHNRSCALVTRLLYALGFKKVSVQ